MSTYVLMRILESAPSRYDLGIGLLTLGYVQGAYDRLAGRIERGRRVLDLGCGTGAFTLPAARRGAAVKGVDTDARMLEIAERRVKEAGMAEAVELAQMGVAELDGEEASSYDVVTSGLCLSELSDDEVRYTLKETFRILRPGGLLLIADEVRPSGFIKRLMHSLVRTPLAALAYIVTQQTTRPISDLPQRLTEAGLSVISTRLSPLGDFGEFVARKSEGGSK